MGLVMNNASVHHTQKAGEFVEGSNHSLIFVPSYSPTMNPIEEIFSKIKFYTRDLLPLKKFNNMYK